MVNFEDSNLIPVLGDNSGDGICLYLAFLMAQQQANTHSEADRLEAERMAAHITKLALLIGAIPWREAINVLHCQVDPCVGVVETLAYFTSTDIMVIHISN